MTLALHDIACARGGVPILQGVTLTLDPGEVILLRGPNGAGKTTLLRTIAGLQPPLSGQIKAAPDSIAYGAHADGCKAMLSVGENMEFWAGIYGTREIDTALRAFNMAALRHRLAQNLSAGQKRRLGLARLMVTGRSIWALDEPTVSLDTASVALFAEAIKSHLAAGGSAIIATHIDLGFAAREIDIAQFRATAVFQSHFDEAFE